MPLKWHTGAAWCQSCSVQWELTKGGLWTRVLVAGRLWNLCLKRALERRLSIFLVFPSSLKVTVVSTLQPGVCRRRFCDAELSKNTLINLGGISCCLIGQFGTGSYVSRSWFPSTGLGSHVLAPRCSHVWFCVTTVLKIDAWNLQKPSCVCRLVTTEIWSWAGMVAPFVF